MKQENQVYKESTGSTTIHLNKLRSHEQFSIEGLEPFIEEVMGKDFMLNVIANLQEIILSRVPEGDETKREFKSRFVLSCYVQDVEVKAAIKK